MNNMTVKQRLEQFDVKHGDVAVLVDGWWLFPDGAMRESNPMGGLVEPPAEDYERYKLVVLFHEHYTARAERDYEELNGQIEFQFSEADKYAAENAPPPPPSDEQLNRLKALAELVKERRKGLANARRALTRGTPKEARDREANAHVARERISQAREQFKKIKI